MDRSLPPGRLSSHRIPEVLRGLTLPSRPGVVGPGKMVPPPGELLGSLLNESAHAYLRSELVDGWSRRELENALAAGQVRRLLPGVYVGAEQLTNPIARGQALNLWAPQGLVSGELALQLYAPALPTARFADLILPYGARVRPQTGVRVRCGAMSTTISSPSGVRCVSPERALLDAWHRCDESRREDLLYRALWERVTSWRVLRRELARTPRVAGRVRLERILRQFEAGATSPLEVLARTDVFVGAEFREFEWQAPIDASGMKVADMLHRSARLVVELDGWAYHSARERAARDRQRDIELAAAGFVTIRLGFSDLRGRPQWCRDRVLEIVARRIGSERSLRT